MCEIFDSIPSRISPTVDEHMRAIVWVMRRWSEA